MGARNEQTDEGLGFSCAFECRSVVITSPHQSATLTASPEGESPKEGICKKLSLLPGEKVDARNEQTDEGLGLSCAFECRSVVITSPHQSATLTASPEGESPKEGICKKLSLLPGEKVGAKHSDEGYNKKLKSSKKLAKRGNKI